MENITDADILHYIDSLLKKTNGMNRKEILSQHPYEIWLGADGRWWTYLPDKDHPNNRRPLARKVRENLEDGIVDFYKQKKRLVSVALKDFYPEWFCYKESMKISSGTLRRYDQYWAKYYEGGTMAAMPLQDLDSVYLTKWAHDTIEKFNMSSKEFNNMKIILTGSLKLAKKKHVLSVNPWEDVEINSKSFRVVHKKPSNTQVFLDDEIPSLVKEIQDDLIRHPYRTDALAVCLDSQLGLRIGELVALKWTDREDAYIRIQRMELSLIHI